MIGAGILGSDAVVSVRAHFLTGRNVCGLFSANISYALAVLISWISLGRPIIHAIAGGLAL